MKQTSKLKKAQTAEILNFLVLVVAVTVIILVLKFVVIDSVTDTGGTAQEAQEEGSFRSGANAFMVMTEERSGKTFLELLGYVGYTENTTVDLGGPKKPLVINVTEEVAKRLDKIYGEGHWYLELPIPHRSGIEIIVVSDTSGSMCNDVLDLRDGLNEILRELKDADKETRVYLYFLGPFPAQGCFWKDNASDSIHNAKVSCTDFDEIKCIDISLKASKRCKEVYPLHPGRGKTEEDWGNGLACLAETGPEYKEDSKEGWGDFSIRIIMPLSDELPCGSETCPGKDQRESLEHGIESAKKNKVKVFPLRADPCGITCTSASGPCINMVTHMGGIYCNCGSGLLVEWMNEIADETGGKMYDLAGESNSAAQAIKDIVYNQSFERKPVVLGSPIPGGKRIRSFIVAAPMPNYDYLNLTLKQWN